jgi:hypothetical protein
MLGMKSIVRRVKELIEATEPDMTAVSCGCEEPFACPVGIALWEEYRGRNPDGFKVPPVDLKDCTVPDLLPYAKHVDTCDDFTVTVFIPRTTN